MLIIKRKQLNKIVNHTLCEYPLEACGIAGGKDGLVEEVYPLSNQDNSAVTYFASPEEQLEVFKDLRKKGLELMLIYHSHPASPAWPSRTDVERAFFPKAAYLIVSLENVNRPEIRAFKIQEGKIKKITLKVTGDKHADKNIH